MNVNTGTIGVNATFASLESSDNTSAKRRLGQGVMARIGTSCLGIEYDSMDH